MESSMIEMKPYLKLWYDYLKQGKLMGLRCKDCGRIEFPPVPICRECSCTDLEWFEMSGEGTVVAVSDTPTGIAPYNDDPVICVLVELKEGMKIASFLVGVEEDDIDIVETKLPLRVRAKIVPMNENVYWPAFESAEPIE